MSAVELIAQHEQQLIDAELLLASLNEQWESACRAGEDVAALEDQIDTTARLTKRLNLRLEALHLQAEVEAQQAKVDTATAQVADAIAAIERLVNHRKAISALVAKLKQLIEAHSDEFTKAFNSAQEAGRYVTLAGVRSALEQITDLDLGNVSSLNNLIGTRQNLGMGLATAGHI